MDFEKVARISIQPKTKVDFSIVESALRFIVEQNTWNRLRFENVNKGKAVSAVELVRQYVFNLQEESDASKW